MRLSGEAYSKRLEAYSDDTILLLSQVMKLEKPEVRKGLDIVTDSELGEKQVAEKLKQIKASAEQKKGI